MSEFPDPPPRGVFTRRDRTDGGRHVIAGYDDAGVEVLRFIVPKWFAAWGALTRSLEALLDLHGCEDAGETAPPQKASENENEHLRLVRTGDYSNTGEGFRIWELKHDVEGIAVFETRGVKGKPHAQAGDELWEEADSDLTPFKLKRDGRRIASPEWWMVEDLFKGLSAWHREGETPEGCEEDGGPTSAERRIISGGLFRVQRGREPKPNLGVGPHGSLWVATRPVPLLSVGKDDLLLLCLNYPSQRKMQELRCSKRQLTRSELPVVADNLDAFKLIGHSWDQVWKGSPELLDSAEKKLGRYANDHRARRSTNDKTVRLWALSPLRSDVSQPIRAKSDDGAIFELLLEIGCRPPTEDDDAGS